jgi:predicted alpha/beta hydrolase family esterase
MNAQADAKQDVTVLFVPGLRDHVEDHWQSHAARALPGSRTVEPLVTERLSLAARVAALDAALNAIDTEVVIAAHSAGCLMVAAWAQSPSRAIKGALLATPADVENPLPPGYPSFADLSANGWVPIPRAPLPFPAIVAVSRNDPLASFGKVREFAADWQAVIHDAGEVGHLNPPAGFGPWNEAADLIAQLSA